MLVKNLTRRHKLTFSPALLLLSVFKMDKSSGQFVLYSRCINSLNPHQNTTDDWHTHILGLYPTRVTIVAYYSSFIYLFILLLRLTHIFKALSFFWKLYTQIHSCVTQYAKKYAYSKYFPKYVRYWGVCYICKKGFNKLKTEWISLAICSFVMELWWLRIMFQKMCGILCTCLHLCVCLCTCVCGLLWFCE